MKFNQMLMATFVILMLFITNIATADELTEEQVSKLLNAVWQEKPQTIDITLYETILMPPKSEEQIREMFDDAFNRKNLSGIQAEQRDRDIQLNVERTLKEQEVGKKLKQRIRIDGYRQRIDQVFGFPEMTLMKGTAYEEKRTGVFLGPKTEYDMTLINLGDKQKGEYRSFSYLHSNKTAHITNNKKSMWKQSEVIDFTSMLNFLQSFLGKNESAAFKSVLVPDNDKIQRLKETCLLSDDTLLTVSPDPNSSQNTIIQVRKDNLQLWIRVICDNDDYSKIYYVEIFTPITGSLLQTSKFNEYDSQGFPHSCEITEYNTNGKVKKKEVYVVENVVINSAIPPEIFAFNPPEDYQIIEFDPNGVAKKLRGKGGIEDAMQILIKAQKEKDVATVKELLNYDIWQIRLRSLKVLEKIMADDYDGLKKVALNVKDDEVAEVRQEADRIIKNIEISSKSK